MIQQIKKISEGILHKIPLQSKLHHGFLVSLLSTWLLVQGRLNIRNLCRYLSYSESTVSRRMGHSFDYGLFHEHLFYQASQLEEEGNISNWILCGDCSFIPKSGKATVHLGKFWNGSISKEQLGLEISGFSLVNACTKSAFMVDVAQTPGDLSDKEGKQEDYSRIDFYIDHLKRVYKRYPWIRYVALDGYYTKTKVLTYFEEETNLFLISKLRKNANLLFLLDKTKRLDAHGNQKYDGKFDHKNPLSQKDKWKCLGKLDGEQDIILYQAKMYSPHFKKLLNVILCWNEKTEKHILLYSDDLSLDGQQLVIYYKRRFQIEFLFRDAKQFSGLNHAQVRDEEKLEFHFNTSFAVVNMVRMVQKQVQEQAELNPEKADDEFSTVTFNNAKRLGYNDLLLNEFIRNLDLDPKLPKIQTALKKTVEFGVMRA